MSRARVARRKPEPTVGGTSVVPAGRGRPLRTSERARFEPRFGVDFSNVRIHDGPRADEAARALGARAYTYGSDIVFRRGEQNPSWPGQRLLAHELAHTVQQSGGRRSIQRTPDPVCKGVDVTKLTGEVTAAAKKVAGAGATADDRLLLIRKLKLVRRCATKTQQAQVRTGLETPLGATEAAAVWAESGTAFGGYVGMYPGFASDIKRRLEKLGTSETSSYGSYRLDQGKRTHRRRSKSRAGKELGELGRTDVVYFRGHQYAQYKAPGLFTNGASTYGFDLRYIQKAGGFPNVKVMISTSCATLCKEAFELFHTLFPNAVILGYRKSAPLDGAAVRTEFHKGITGLNKPLLLDQKVDVDAILAVWKKVIETKHKGHRSQKPGYWDGSTLHYWDGAAWQTINATDASNKCRRKGNANTWAPGP